MRKLFETVVARCMQERLVGGEAFAVDASMIVADAHRRRGVAKVEDLDPASSRAVAEYLSVLDDAAFGGASTSEQCEAHGRTTPCGFSSRRDGPHATWSSPRRNSTRCDWADVRWRWTLKTL